MSVSSILGHERPLRVLRRALASGRVPQAYLFWGPDGVGKELVAREVARTLLCTDAGARAEPCGGCPSCRRVAAGEHADLHLVAAAGASVTIQEIRALQETLGYQAFERGRKVAIIRDAFRMTREASNALLKTLEEPPAGTHIVLLAHHRSQLLPTLVSRCQVLRFDPLPEALVRRLLEERGIDAGRAESLVSCSGGCPGAVLAEEPEELAALEDEVSEAWRGLQEMGAAARFALSGRWAGDKDRLGRRLDALERLVRRRVRESALRGGGDGLGELHGLFAARRLLEQNVNAQLALDALFLGLLGEDRDNSR
ncbi:MAG: DNA polymerase III subunit delta' [Deltaproteobacteria bacterium]|nr:DNA polymerase III subunit delta' [Deltaproteobacteria bacterium]